MSEYIERGALLASLRELASEPHYQHNGEDWSVGVCYAREKVLDASAADVVEVKHSSWGESSYDFDEDDFTRPCLACGYDSKEYGNYCPNCGAKMDGGADNG